LGKNPNNAMTFAGTLLLFAAMATLRIKQTTISEDFVLPAGAGH
jgi:maltose/moltooligosaccharide transporter